jgi:hypothetical protein
MLFPSTATVNSNLGIVVEDRVKCKELKKQQQKQGLWGGGGGARGFGGYFWGFK